jgi:hypothetical protein
MKQNARKAQSQSMSPAVGENDPTGAGPLRFDSRLALGAILLFALAAISHQDLESIHESIRAR